MKKLIIIGGGIAGLSAGIFAQLNGFDSTILEKHHTPGGECTGWDRQGYHIDGCIHWLVGTKEGTPLNRLWQTVGALEGVDVYHPDSFMTFEFEDATINLFRNLDRLHSSWLELSPQDKPVIDEFCQAIRTLQSYEVPVDKPTDLMSLGEKLKMLLAMKDIGSTLQKFSKITLHQFADKFQHPALQKALKSLLPEGYSAISIIFSMAAFTKDQASVPYGGSKAMALRMKARYFSLGGRIETSCEAVSLDIQGRTVHQVNCRNGKSFAGDYFIAACDAHHFYQQLLEGKYPDKAYQKRFNDPQVYPLASEVRVAIGYQGNMEAIPRTLRFPTQPYPINSRQIAEVTMTHYHHDSAFAPEGHTLITCSTNQFHADYDVWDALAKEPEAYRQEKERIGQATIAALENRFPQMQGKLNLLDVATPKTFQRFCNAYRGAFMGFMITSSGKMLNHSGRVKGLNNILLSGQWLQPPGGLPTALLTGKDSIMRLCKMENKEFHC